MDVGGEIPWLEKAAGWLLASSQLLGWTASPPPGGLVPSALGKTLLAASSRKRRRANRRRKSVYAWNHGKGHNSGYIEK